MIATCALKVETGEGDGRAPGPREAAAAPEAPLSAALAAVVGTHSKPVKVDSVPTSQ